jgi:kynureninase
MDLPLNNQSDLQFAQAMDRDDPLREFRNEFHIPQADSGKAQVYFAGNSLGLQPKQTCRFVTEELEKWQRLGVRGHFNGAFPWMPYHEFLAEPMAQLIGAHPDEVVMMNSLTVNLHLMMATFYQPNSSRFKILMEDHAFPSDHYAVESQIRWRGLEPKESFIVAAPSSGTEFCSMDDWCELIETHRDELAMIVLPGMQYYTGQAFDMARLTRCAHRHGITIGFDLAHAAGNMELNLHDWQVDFAVWCSYKYLNSGPGSVGGCFVHRNHVSNEKLKRLAGWWGHDKATRFEMGTEFRAIPTAEGWQVSNPSILSLAAIRSSLDVFRRAGGMRPLNEKSRRLTQFFADQLLKRLSDKIEIITPPERGCQLSLKVRDGQVNGREVKRLLDVAGFETDWREPNVIRAAPVPLYNQFVEVYSFVDQLVKILG